MEKVNDYRLLFVLLMAENFLEVKYLLRNEKQSQDILFEYLVKLRDGQGEEARAYDQLIKLLLNTAARLLVQRFLEDARSLAQGQDNSYVEWLLKNKPVTPQALTVNEAAVFALSRATQDMISSFKENVPPNDEAGEGQARFLVGETKGAVELGEVFDLIVKITTQVSGERPGYAVSDALKPIEGNLIISIHGMGLEFPEGTSRSLEVPATGDSPEVLFPLKATEAGMHTLMITAWQASVHVTTIALRIGVNVSFDPVVQKRTPIELRQPEKGEFTLEIIYEKKYNRYRFQLRGEGWGHSKPEFRELETERKEQYDTLLSSINAQARNLYNLSLKVQILWIKSVGTFMSNYLLPAELKASLWEQRYNIKRLNIICDGDLLPWELLYLQAPDGGTGFSFTDWINIARWRYGPPPPSSIKLQDTYLVHPDGSPAYTKKEIEQLTQIFPDANIITNMDSLLDVLTTGNFSMLHFASHNNIEANNLGGSYIPFGNSRFDRTLMGSVDPKKYAGMSPLVFMNACTTAGKSPLFAEMTSWADQYLDLGAGAFVGSLWEVVDDRAPEFSKCFYETLKAGKSLGEAMSASRSILEKNDPGDPTRFAYTLYGNPLAKLENI